MSATSKKLQVVSLTQNTHWFKFHDAAAVHIAQQDFHRMHSIRAQNYVNLVNLINEQDSLGIRINFK